jgi:hypothetical protein
MPDGSIRRAPDYGTIALNRWPDPLGPGPVAALMRETAPLDGQFRRREYPQMGQVATPAAGSGSRKLVQPLV